MIFTFVYILCSCFISVEPSFNDVKMLLSGDNVDIAEVVEALEGIVNDLIESGQTASEEFTNVCKY